MRHSIRNRFIVALALMAASLVFASLGSAAPRPAAATADLRITKSDGPDPVSVGAQLTYTIGVENLGPSPATGVTVTDTLPKDVSLVSAVGPSGSCAVKKTKVTCAIGALNPAGVVYGGAPVSITIVVVPRKTGTLRNTATVAGDQKDPARANNQATADDHDPRRPDLQRSCGDGHRIARRRSSDRHGRPGCDRRPRGKRLHRSGLRP